jgi:hypothetical protein
MLESGDARGAARHIKHIILKIKKAAEFAPQNQLADIEFLLEKTGKLLLKAEDIHTKTLQ